MMQRANTSTQVVVNAQNQFGLRMLDLLLRQQPHDNALISPLSLWQCGALAQLGTGGDAKAGLRRALAIPATLPDDSLNAATLALRNALQAQNAQHGVTLSVANALWGSKLFQLEPTFVKDCQRYLGAQTTTLDFASPSAVQQINNWVSIQTQGKIKELVQPGDLSADMPICLTNAIYFHGQWQKRFDAKDTHHKTFHCANGTQQTVPLMALKELKGAYLSGDTFDGVRLPYQTSTCALWALLPHHDKTPADVLPHLNVAQLRAQRHKTPVNLQLPRFKMAFSEELSEDFKALGATPAFAADADFRPLFGGCGAISILRHKAILEVDEEGTVAAAATEMAVRGRESEAPLALGLIFDRPFVVALIEEKSGALLMLGVVNAPEQLN